jgi:N-acetylglucosaminyl-diphospho-decaprenol L-rhamnosyltransferase
VPCARAADPAPACAHAADLGWGEPGKRQGFSVYPGTVAAAGPTLDVVIVSFRCRDLLHACLATLQRHGRARGGLGVTVVDNASRDGTTAMVRAQFPWVDFVGSETNLGFAAATNLGIRRSAAPYLLALNPDTRVAPGALDALVDLMEREPRVGVCGPALVREDGTPDHAAKRSFPTPLGALGHFAGLGGRSGAPAALRQYRAPEVRSGPVDAVNGAFMLMRRSALDEVGLFDEGYWMYMEDLDLSYRLAEAGWLTWYEPTVEVLHVKGGSSGRYRTPRLNYAFHYGMFRFYRKHYAPSRNPLLNGLVYGGIGGKLALSLGRSAWERRVRRVLREHAPASPAS